MGANTSTFERAKATPDRRVRWAGDLECKAQLLEDVKYVETEYGLPEDADERTKRAYFSGLERQKLRRQSEAQGAAGVRRKPEGQGYLCTQARAGPQAVELAKEMLAWGS